jgi:hypothetical protein
MGQGKGGANQGRTGIKKTLIASTAFAAALTMGALQANAFCITFGDGAGGSFCDLMEVSTTSGILWGKRAGCVGPTAVGGTVGFGEASGSFGSDVQIWVYTFDIGARRWSNQFTDGNSLTPFHQNLPFSFTAGACPPAIEGGGFSSTDAQ